MTYATMLLRYIYADTHANSAQVQEKEVSSTSDSQEEQQPPIGEESQYC